MNKRRRYLAKRRRLHARRFSRPIRFAVDWGRDRDWTLIERIKSDPAMRELFNAQTHGSFDVKPPAEPTSH